MVALAALRDEIADVLKAAGHKADTHVPETVTPPFIAVVPDDPYISTEGAPFGNVHVNIAVLVIGAKGTNRAAASALDETLSALYALLNESYDLGDVGQPLALSLNGNAYLGAVIPITETTTA